MHECKIQVNWKTMNFDINGKTAKEAIDCAEALHNFTEIVFSRKFSYALITFSDS
jgi:hypothetical protein